VFIYGPHKIIPVKFTILYSSPNIVRVIKSRRMRWAGHVTRMGEKRGVYGVLVGKPEGKRPMGRPRRRWVDNIRVDLQEVGCGYVERGQWGDLGVDGWIILGWISRRWNVGMWTGMSWPRIGTGGGRL